MCDKEAMMTVDGYTDLHVGSGRGAKDEREGSKHSHLSWWGRVTGGAEVNRKMPYKRNELFV